MLDPCPTPTEPPLPPPWLPPPPEPPAPAPPPPAPPPPPCAQLRLVTLTEINRDKREVKIAFTIRFDEYNYKNLQRLSPAPQNVLMSAKIKALGNPGRTRATITVGRKPRRFGYATLFVMHPDAPGLSHVPASSCKYLNSKYHDWRDRPDRFMIKSPASKAVSKRRIDINENPARDRLVNQIRDWPYGGELIETGRFLFRSA
jgi:hypothetical protein